MIRLTDPRHVGTVLGALRAADGRSQRVIAGLAGVPQPRISGYEAGKHVPRLAAVMALATELGYDLAFVPREDA